MTTNNLTEQWKKGELKPNTYYCKIKDNDYIFRLNYEQGMFFDYFWERMEYDDIEKVLAEVPSYEEWQPFTDPYFKGLTTKHISELAKKSIRLTTQHCEDNEEIEILREQLDLKNDMVDKLIRENEKLKELLKDSRFMLREMANVNNWFEGDDCEPNYYMATECEKYADKIDEVLK